MFSEEYLEHCRKMRPAEIVEFLENFRLLHGGVPAKSRLISLKVSEPLLNAFKAKAKSLNVPYQTQIKRLMQDWLDVSCEE